MFNLCTVLYMKRHRFIYTKILLLLWVCLVPACVRQTAQTEANKVQILKTDTGMRFGLTGKKSSQPAPTLVILSGTIEDALTGVFEDDSSGVKLRICDNNTLAQNGFIYVSLDLPCHGLERRDNEMQGLDGWRYRIEHGENFIPEFNARLNKMLDYLIKEGYSDPEKIALLGISRGGFLAMHFISNESRVKCTVAIAPVVDLGTLREFKGLEQNSMVTSIALSNYAGKLSGKAILITIGDQDARVDTDKVIAFARSVSQASGKESHIELRVMPEPRGHYSSWEEVEQSAVWLTKELFPKTKVLTNNIGKEKL